MSQASSKSESGDVIFGDPNAAKSAWIPWAIGGVIVLALVFILTKGKH